MPWYQHLWDTSWYMLVFAYSETAKTNDGNFLLVLGAWKGARISLFYVSSLILPLCFLGDIPGGNGYFLKLRMCGFYTFFKVYSSDFGFVLLCWWEKEEIFLAYSLNKLKRTVNKFGYKNQFDFMCDFMKIVIKIRYEIE